jgi:hypothetical protein
MSNESERQAYAKWFSGGFVFGVILVCVWMMFYVASLDVGTSQDPYGARHIDDNENF